MFKAIKHLSIKCFWCIALVFISQSGVIANEQKSANVSTLLRTTIFVRDMDTSLEFFKNVLALTIRVDRVLEGPALNAILGTHEKKARIVILQSGNTVTGNIALLTYLNDPVLPEKKHDATLDAGEVALVMETQKIDFIYQAVKDRGYIIVSPPRVLFSQPNMISQTREMIFIGPEGVAINLIQRGVRQ